MLTTRDTSATRPATQRQAWQPPRTPAPFNPTAHIMGGLNAVIRCLAWLESEGFRPRHAIADADRYFPIITIEVCPECERLKTQYAAYTYGWEPQGGKRAILWRTEKFGCRIEWSERGH